MKRTLAIAFAFILAALSSGCAIARANAIRNLKVMPAEWSANAEGQRRCVAWATTGQCQLWLVLPDGDEETP